MTLSPTTDQRSDRCPSTGTTAFSWRVRLLPPDDLLSRVRWLLLMVSWVVSLPRLALIWSGPADFPIRLLGSAALLALCGWWLRGYRRQSFPMWAIPFEGL